MKTLYLDIETIPDYDRLDLFGLDPLPAEIPPASLADCPDCGELAKKSVSDIAKVLAKINPPELWLEKFEATEQQNKDRAGVMREIDRVRDRTNVLEQAQAERMKKMSIDPEMCRVAAIGWAFGDGEPQAFVLDYSADEKQMLSYFWEELIPEGRPVVGYNVTAFDLPILFIRSAIHGLQATRKLDMRPWGNDVCDLMTARFPKGSRAKKLKDLARLYGIEVPEDDIDGSHVADLYQFDPQRVERYVKSDVEVTRSLHEFYAGFFC